MRKTLMGWMVSICGGKSGRAALELFEKRAGITEIATKYGYNLPASFTRAFKEFHGVSPQDVINGYNNFKLLTKISAKIVTTGSIDISYSIFKKNAFTISGYKGISTFSDTECCEDAWNDYYNSEFAEKLSKASDSIYVAYYNKNNAVDCYFGLIDAPYPDKINIPESLWAVFVLNKTDDDYVNGFYNDVLFQWLSSSGYVKDNDIPNIEVFPTDMNESGFSWQIWIPIRKGETLS